VCGVFGVIESSVHDAAVAQFADLAQLFRIPRFARLRLTRQDASVMRGRGTGFALGVNGGTAV
jgi:hypothetical protein